MTYPAAVSAIAALKAAGLDYGFLLAPAERDAFLHGLLVTLELCLLAIPASLAAGVLLCRALMSPAAWLSNTARGFIEVTRNTPTLVQLYCAYLVLNMLATQYLQAHGITALPPFLWVIVVISLHKAAFHADALRAGTQAVPPAMLEAARSLGFSGREIHWRVTFPLAARWALPSLVNNTVDLVKMTAIASAIAVGDVTYESIMIWTQRDNVLELLLLILIYFGVLTWAVSIAGRRLEEHYRMPGYGQ